MCPYALWVCAVHPSSQIAFNDDNPAGGLSSLVTFTAQANTVYRIQVDGFNGLRGNVALDLWTGVGTRTRTPTRAPTGAATPSRTRTPTRAATGAATPSRSRTATRPSATTPSRSRTATRPAAATPSRSRTRTRSRTA
jgi:hypothetical protein